MDSEQNNEYKREIRDLTKITNKNHKWETMGSDQNNKYKWETMGSGQKKKIKKTMGPEKIFVRLIDS